MYMHVCIYIGALYDTYIHIIHTRIHTYIHTCIHTYMHVYIGALYDTYIHAFIYTRIYVCMHDTYVCMYIYPCIYMYIYALHQIRLVIRGTVGGLVSSIEVQLAEV